MTNNIYYKNYINDKWNKPINLIFPDKVRKILLMEKSRKKNMPILISIELDTSINSVLRYQTYTFLIS